MLKVIQAHETKTLTTSTSTTIQIPTGGKLHEIMLRFATSADADVTEAAIRAEIGVIRLTINGVDFVNATAAKILDAYEALGLNVGNNTGVASVLELNLGRLLFTDPQIRDLFGIGTANVQSVQITVTAGTLSTIANVTGFTGREMVSENLGVYSKYINYARSFNATGQDTFDTLPRDPDASYMMVLSDAGASGTQTYGQIRVNNINVKDNIPIAINRLDVSNNRYQSPSGYFVYAFTDGNIKSRLPMVGVNDLRFINQFSVAPGAAGYNMSVMTIHNLPTNL